MSESKTTELIVARHGGSDGARSKPVDGQRTVPCESRRMTPKVRATAVLVEDGRILLVEQAVTRSLPRRWSLPGGRVEAGETLAECLVREVREETGLEVETGRLLYACDRIVDGAHVVHITLEVRRTGGQLETGKEPEAGASPIRSVRMVPLASLGEYGFSETFRRLAREGFPDSGTYRGSVENIGL